MSEFKLRLIEIDRSAVGASAKLALRIIASLENYFREEGDLVAANVLRDLRDRWPIVVKSLSGDKKQVLHPKNAG